MQKLLLLSVVLAVIGIPVVAARDRSAVRSVKKTIVMIAFFNLCYLLAIRFLYSHLE